MAIRGPTLPRSNYNSSYFPIANRIESPTRQLLANCWPMEGDLESRSRQTENVSLIRVYVVLKKNERTDENSAK